MQIKIQNLSAASIRIQNIHGFIRKFLYTQMIFWSLSPSLLVFSGPTQSASKCTKKWLVDFSRHNFSNSPMEGIYSYAQIHLHQDAYTGRNRQFNENFYKNP